MSENISASGVKKWTLDVRCAVDAEGPVAMRDNDGHGQVAGELIENVMFRLVVFITGN